MVAQSFQLSSRRLFKSIALLQDSFSYSTIIHKFGHRASPVAQGASARTFHWTASRNEMLFGSVTRIATDGSGLMLLVANQVLLRLLLRTGGDCLSILALAMMLEWRWRWIAGLRRLFCKSAFATKRTVSHSGDLFRSLVPPNSRLITMTLCF
jgi:hypothetical protein